MLPRGGFVSEREKRGDPPEGGGGGRGCTCCSTVIPSCSTDPRGGENEREGELIVGLIFLFEALPGEEPPECLREGLGLLSGLSAGGELAERIVKSMALSSRLFLRCLSPCPLPVSEPNLCEPFVVAPPIKGELPAAW